MQSSVPLTRGTPAAYAPAAPRVAVRSLRTFAWKTGRLDEVYTIEYSSEHTRSFR
jgi:hypothetical protein